MNDLPPKDSPGERFLGATVHVLAVLAGFALLGLLMKECEPHEPHVERAPPGAYQTPVRR